MVEALLLGDVFMLQTKTPQLCQRVQNEDDIISASTLQNTKLDESISLKSVNERGVMWRQ